MTAFWFLAPVIVLAALGILVVRRAVHAALLLAVVMVSLAVLYLGLDAPFLFVVQIIVYTGAILMLFLFVLMLVGVDHSDSRVETIPGQRQQRAGAAQVSLGAAVGLDRANAQGNVRALADLLFSRWVFVFEATSALLVTAAVGAMVLTHRERERRVGQAELAARRLREFAESGRPLGPLPAPGVYARSNAVDTPALLPDGTPATISVNRTLLARGQVRSASDEAQWVDEVLDELAGRTGEREGGD